MNNNAQENLLAAIERRRIVRNAFKSFCNCKASLGSEMGQRIENDLVAANQAVKDARKALKVVNQ